MGTYDNLDDSNDQHYFHDGRFYVPQGSTSATTSIQTANQLGEVNNRLNAGVFGVDIAPIDPNILEQIPQQHFEEMHRLAKLSGATVSMHGPILDLVGFQQGGRYDELSREQNQRIAEFALERAHYLNPEGNTFMNIHINNQTPGVQWRAAREEELKEARKNPKLWEGIIVEDKFHNPAVMEAMGIVNRDSGEFNIMKLERKEYPEGPRFWTPQERLENLNITSWDQSQLQIFQLQKEKRELEEAQKKVDLQLLDLEYRENKNLPLDPQQQAVYNNLKAERDLLQAHDQELNRLIGSGLKDVFHKLKWLPTDEQEAKKLKAFRENFQKEYAKRNQQIESIQEEAERLQKQGKKLSQEKLMQYYQLAENNYRFIQTELAKVGYGPGKEVPVPELYVPSNYVAEENTVKTISDSMFNTYKKFKENSPVFTLENYQSYLTLGTAQDMVDVIEKTRKEFATKLQKEMKLTPKEAQAAAEKHIAATWDVGHINFMKRHGFDDKDVMKETEKVAKYVKQLHITDNFGFSDAHMPPGMGNAPIEEQFKELKKQGFKFDKGRLIIEAGPYVGTFKENPQLYTLEHFNSPLYSSVVGKGAPTWSEFPPSSYGQFTTGFGNLLPDVHFRELYGAGFSTLPRELGGQFGGNTDRFSGTPLQ